MEVERFTLSNGVRVLVIPMPSVRTAAIQVWFSCGSRAEGDREAGLAHMNEHMFFRGGKDFPDSKSVDRELWLLGENYNGATNYEYVVYFIITSPELLPRAAHLLSDMLIYARFDAGCFEKERGAVIRELQQTLDDPEDLLTEGFFKLFFGSHSLGRTSEEELNRVRSFTVDEARSFKERFYGSPNMVISVAGGVSVCETRELLERYFGAISQKEPVVWREFQEPQQLVSAGVIKKRALAQAYLCVGSPAPSILSDDLAVSKALNEIFSKRLWFSVRDEKGLAYRIESDISSFSDAGVLLVTTSVSPEKENVKIVLELILEAMRSICDGGITEQECEDVKTALRAKVDLSLASSGNVAWFFGSSELLMGNIQSVGEKHAEIEAITRERIISLAQALWREELVRAFLVSSKSFRFEKIFPQLRSVLR